MRIKSIATGKETTITKEAWDKLGILGNQSKFTVTDKSDKKEVPKDVVEKMAAKEKPAKENAETKNSTANTDAGK